ncbi:hypothetical protein BH20ACT5_BH20ACT5_03890 [soil metagenome]
MSRNTVLRTLHDVGLAAWFGGSLMGAVGLNAAAGAVNDPKQRGLVANTGWDRWTPVNAAAIGAHLVGAAGLLVANRDRVADQAGVRESSAAKTVLTGLAIGVTAYSRVLGARVSKAGDVAVESGAQPNSQTPAQVADAQRQLSLIQWAIPGVTGALIAVSALQGEQQAAEEQLRGRLGKAAKRLTSVG